MKKISLLLISFFTLQTISAQAPSQQWLSKYNGTGDHSDKFNAIKVDASGNIYLAGYTVNSGNKKDFLTVKMNSSGDTLWTRTIDGLGKSDDEILELAIDASGNAYVTGTSKGSTTNDDYLTAKYNTTGVLLWSATYNYISNQDEQPNAIGVDAAGNVYVTGQSDNDASAAVVNDDYATVKYSSTGVQLWAVRFNGSGNGTDRATAMAVTSAGTVYITGRSNNGTDDDFVTIKYSTGGVQTWNQILDLGDKEKAEVLTIDASEKVYVSGRGNNGTDDDFLTIKYSASGTDLWSGGVTYSGMGDDKPTAIAVDGSGNVYVTGRTDSDATAAVNYDFGTVKYNSTGTEVWSITYNGTGNGNDTPSGIAVDGSGKVIVCGQYDGDASLTVTNNNSIVISYSAAGTQTWLSTNSGTSNLSDGANAISLDASGTIYIAGSIDNLISQKDGLVVKLTTGGTQTWVKNYNGLGDNSDNVNKIIVDAAGNSYLAGYTYNAGSEKDLLVAKLDPSGILLWSAQYNGSSNNSDEATDIAIDGTGNVYITGYTKESISGYNYITSKYGPTGTLLWSTQYNNTLVNGTDKAVGICIDGLGNVYVTGSSYSTMNGNEDFVTIQYNSAGVQQWLQRFNGAGNNTDIPIGIKLKGTDVYVAGRSVNISSEGATYIKYDNLGVWQASGFGGGSSATSIVRPSSFDVDINGSVYITGKINDGLDDKIFTVKFASLTGGLSWTKFYDNTNGDDRATAITVDAVSNTYITGKTASGISDDFITIKYDLNGTELWVTTFDGASHLNDIATDIKIDANGDLIVAGEIDNGTTLNPNVDFNLIKYHSDGTEMWSKSYDGADHLTDGINSIAIDNMNNIYVTGNSSLTSEQKNIVTIKYDSPVGINELDPAKNLTSAFPNPFTFSTTISIPSDIILGENCSFELYDILGNKVKSIDTITEHSFNINRDSLSNGMYIFKLNQSGKILSTGKLTVN